MSSWGGVLFTDNTIGFTLIELLAVIVILAVIALIATPIVLNIIEQARYGSAKSSAIGYVEASEKAAILYLMENRNGKITGDCTAKSNVLTCGENILTLDIKGSLPSSGTLTYDGQGNVNTVTDLIVIGYKFSYKDGKWTGEKDNTPVEPEKPVLSSLNVSPSKIEIEVEGKQQITVTANPSEAEIDIEYTSESDTIASVTEEGIVEGKEVGKTNITVKDRKTNIEVKVPVTVGILATTSDIGKYVTYTPTNLTWSASRDGVSESEDKTQGKFNIYDRKTRKAVTGLGKDKSITCYDSSYQTTTEGWRIMNVSSSGQITLIHAGTPECYYHGYPNYSEASKTILRAAATSTSNEGEGKAWTKYGSSLAQSIHYMTELDYNTIMKNKNGNSNWYMTDMDYSGSTCYQKSQAECGKDYDMIDIGSYYWLASAYSTSYLYRWAPDYQEVNYGDSSLGVRPVIILKSTVKIKSGTGESTDPYILTT